MLVLDYFEVFQLDLRSQIGHLFPITFLIRSINHVFIFCDCDYNAQKMLSIDILSYKLALNVFSCLDYYPNMCLNSLSVHQTGSKGSSGSRRKWRPVMGKGSTMSLTLQVWQRLLWIVLVDNRVLNNPLDGLQNRLVVAQRQHAVDVRVQQAVTVKHGSVLWYFLAFI